MSSYGRNFDFRKPPEWGDRNGRFVMGGSTDIPIGTPVIAALGATQDSTFTGALPVTLATGAQAPRVGMCGIAVYEWIDLNQLDPLYFTPSDRDTVPVGKMLQVVSDPDIKVVFRNTVARSFLGQRDYAGRIMVAGLGATPTLAIGDLLTPGVGDDVSGYWAETAIAADAWLRITSIDTTRGEVEAQMVF